MNRRITLFGELSKNKIMFMMIFPACLYFIMFNYLPMVGLILAFKEYTFSGGILGSPWAGLKNFKFLFIAGSFGGVLRNTILYNVAFMVASHTSQVLFAIFIAEITGKFFKRGINAES